MSSINTNASAMTALQSLSATNKNLEITQGRISTGLRVAEASDNAAYWSIATTMRSDNKALGTVQDALGLGAATVDTAYTGMNAAIDTVDKIKTKLVASLQPGVDKAKIQSEIDQLKLQLESTAGASSFNGQNWLSRDKTAADADKANLVSSFTRDATNGVSVGTTTVEVKDVVLFDTQGGGTLTGSETGILDGKVKTLTTDGGLANGQDSQLANTAASVTLFTAVNNIKLTGDDKITFNLSIDGTSHAITIDKATVDDALNSKDGIIADDAAMKTVLTRALGNAGITSEKVTIDDTTGVALTITDDAADNTISVSDARAIDGTSYGSLAAVDVTKTTSTDAAIRAMISDVDKMLGKMATAASDLGAVKSRVDSQKDFASKLSDAIDRGVGQLVDADMSKESSRLSALQVQQQLGIQALSIANSNTQSIMSLFR